MGSQTRAVKIQLGIIAIALNVLMTKRLDYSGTVDPFANFDDYYFPEDSRAKNAWKRLGDKLRRISNFIRNGGLQGESIFINDFPDAINYLSGILAPLLLAEARDPDTEEELYAAADSLVGIITQLIEKAETLDASNAS